MLAAMAGPHTDHAFVEIFLTTFRSFTTEEKVLDRLTATFEETMSDSNASPEQRVDMRYRYDCAAGSGQLNPNFAP